MELRQLRYFMEVAEREHMTEAAEVLHVAQSAVSLQITKLEAELGVSLFERTGRNLKLTPIGQIFLTHTKSAIKAIDHAKEKVDEYLDPKHGTIKIGYPTSLASHLLPTVISAFRHKSPNVSFHMRQGSYSRLIEAIKIGDINIAFLGPVPTKDPDINTNILFRENISALVPANHPLSDKKSLFLSDLRNEDFVLFPKGYILQKIAVDACKQAGFVPNITSEGEDMDAIKGLVSAGIGVSLLPDSTFSGAAPNLTVKIPIDSPQVTRSVGIITPKHRDLAPSEKVFYQFTKEFFSVLEQYQ
ncbi:LysR family transcriptional activator of glutamate synthase operon [Bacillus pakistanensis]|uniref:LysR family transcriptional activator of glutamate synthase operon n=1 Tax=Rossellomorea pakistanensis TaxID=992288 RepID=A0ABS2N832_9BACI|nr:LysR family transcriptional regulator [Bacillus pakistanensis]MBM7583988.1 LysR family transcriptional activator of glutamate synthase operon [Bacillus pakistanensis]